MVVAEKPLDPSRRRVPNEKHVSIDKYHLQCYSSKEGKQHSKKNHSKKEENKMNSQKVGSNEIIYTNGIPANDPNIKKVFFEKGTFERLKNKAKFLTPEMRMQMIAQTKEEKQQKAIESTLRKQELQEYDTCIGNGPMLTELEEEATRKAQHLLARARELRQEQEDEIKRCNALILATKCHAIRDAQIAEKKLIEIELANEEKRLEEMMEQERQIALRKQEKDKELQKLKKQQYVKAVLEQIQENELQREMAAERTEEEARLANEAAFEVQLDELKCLKQKMAEQAKQRQEMNLINQQLHYFASLEKEENRLAELKVQEYMRRKAESEAAHQRQLEQLALEKEKELARLRAMQKRAADTQAAKDEMNAMRIQDEVEREWRRKEKEAALLRAKKTEDLKKAREQQVLDRRKCQAIEIQREKEESERIANVNRKALEKEKLEEQRRLCMIENHRMELLKQISEKEKGKIKSRQELFEEGLAITVEKQKRENMLKETMLKKMNMIRSHQVPEKYVHEVERQLKITG